MVYAPNIWYMISKQKFMKLQNVENTSIKLIMK